MKFKLSFFLVIALATFFSCEQQESAKQQIPPAGAAQQVVVEEVIQATSYTYLNVKAAAGTYWLACPKMKVKKGESVYHDPGLEMRDFHSKDLDRTFAKVYFVQNVRRQGQAPSGGMAKQPSFKKMQPNMLAKGPIETVEGVLTLDELFKNKEKYANKRVTVAGEVTKFLPEIMNKNFLHIQAAKAGDQPYDLSITTLDRVKVGDKVKFTGVIAVDKDFGAGYKYEVIMEGAKLVKGM